MAPYAGLSSEESYQSRYLEKVYKRLDYWKYLHIVKPSGADQLCCAIQASQQVAKNLYESKVQPTTLIPKQVGNMYTASLYAALASVIHNRHETLV